LRRSIHITSLSFWRYSAKARQMPAIASKRRSIAFTSHVVESSSALSGSAPISSRVFAAKSSSFFLSAMSSGKIEPSAPAPVLPAEKRNTPSAPHRSRAGASSAAAALRRPSMPATRPLRLLSSLGSIEQRRSSSPPSLFRRFRCSLPKWRKMPGLLNSLEKNEVAASSIVCASSMITRE